MSRYFQGYISATTKQQADEILDLLLRKKLVAGGLLLNGPTRFWWKGKIVDSHYYNISVFTKEPFKQPIIEEVQNLSNEEVPMVWFIELDGNTELLTWVDTSLL
ncbi:MAG TPA: divalent cation tolerance protein CutA [Patescibacteria group bacterium]|nr:divalent cation tolerance protein CutA [Patescibacteria group bacterium]